MANSGLSVERFINAKKKGNPVANRRKRKLVEKAVAYRDYEKVKARDAAQQMPSQRRRFYDEVFASKQEQSDNAMSGNESEGFSDDDTDRETDSENRKTLGCAGSEDITKKTSASTYNVKGMSSSHMERAVKDLKAKGEKRSTTKMPKPDPLLEAKRLAVEREEAKRRAAEEKAKRKKELEEKIATKKRSSRKMRAKTRRGQPVMKFAVKNILSKLQSERS